jgi:hypothetical protein
MMGEMTRRAVLGAGAAWPLMAGAALAAPALGQQVVSVEGAPFAMPPIIVPDFTHAPRFPITRFGAAGADKARNTSAIARAIEAAAHAGGGRVVIPAGTWATGGIRLSTSRCILKMARCSNSHPIRPITCRPCPAVGKGWNAPITRPDLCP